MTSSVHIVENCPLHRVVRTDKICNMASIKCRLLSLYQVHLNLYDNTEQEYKV